MRLLGSFYKFKISLKKVKPYFLDSFLVISSETKQKQKQNFKISCEIGMNPDIMSKKKISPKELQTLTHLLLIVIIDDTSNIQ